MEYLKNAKARIDEANELIGRAIGLEKLSTIERDIILDKLAKAYENILTGRLVEVEIPKTQRCNDDIVMIQPEIRTETQKEKPIILTEEAKKVDIQIPLSPKEIIVPKQEVVKELKPEVAPKHDIGEQTHGEVLGDKFQGKQKFRNEIIAEHTLKADMSTRLQNKPIGDLAKAIGINDKFLFIKELFEGDSARYSETISHLNSFSDLNDAIIFLQDNFQWSETNEYAAKFIDLVRRKFI